MISVTNSKPVPDRRDLDPTEPSPPSAPQPDTLAESSADPITAFAANFGLHPDIAKYAGPKGDSHGSGAPLEMKKEKQPVGNPPPATSCKALPSSYDLDTVTDKDIKDLRACGQDRLADTIVNAKASYGDLLASKQIKIRVLTSAGNGGQPVMVVTGPKFNPKADVHVHTHYHGDNATVADPLGSKSGLNARIREVVLGKGKDHDDQAMFVLPEASNSKPQVDSPTNDLRYHVSWDNVSDQVKTVNDALATVHVDPKAVTERVVSAHSGGGMAINNLINADPKGGTRLQADRLDLQDCLYHFNLWVKDKVVDGKLVKGHWEQPEEWHTDKRLEQWAKTPNGKAVREVVFYSAGSDDAKGSRAARVEKSFPPDASGNARFRVVDMSKEPKLFGKDGKIDPGVDPVAHDAGGNTIAQKVKVKELDKKPAEAHDYVPMNHYRTVGQHLGERVHAKPATTP